jgi:hypothetical protein
MSLQATELISSFCFDLLGEERFVPMVSEYLMWKAAGFPAIEFEFDA